MWNISKEVKEKFDKCHLLPIPESDEEWEMILQKAKEEGEDLDARLEEDLEEVKDELLQVLPSRFIPYLKNGTLNQPNLPKMVRDDYLQWMEEADTAFEKILDAAYELTVESVIDLPASVQEVFAESLHDSIIQRLERDEETLHLYISTDGGFSSKALIHLMFKKIISEESEQQLQVGNWLIYNELQKTEEGFAFRVLFDGPSTEWTITMKEMDAAYYYYPSLYITLHDEGKLEETTLTEYVSQLNPDDRYWFITPDVTCEVKELTGNITLENGEIEFHQDEFVVTTENKTFTYSLDEYHPIQFIYIDIYDDPYAKFNQPIPTEELESAALGNDLELQVRAWNTMYANPEDLVDIINRVLLKARITEENKMMISVFINHFYQKGILSKVNVDKYRALMD